MADISIEVNEINVMSVERSTKGYLSLSVKAQLRQLKTANVLLKTERIGAYWYKVIQRNEATLASFHVL